MTNSSSKSFMDKEQLQRELNKESNKEKLESLYHLLFNGRAEAITIDITVKTDLQSPQEAEKFGFYINEEVKEYLEMQESNPMFAMQNPEMDFSDFALQASLKNVDMGKMLYVFGILLDMTTCTIDVNPKV